MKSVAKPKGIDQFGGFDELTSLNVGKIFDSNHITLEETKHTLIFDNKSLYLNEIKFFTWEDLEELTFNEQIIKPAHAKQATMILSTINPESFKKLLLRYDGKSTIGNVLIAFKNAMCENLAEKLLIISPDALSKTYRQKEMMLVKQAGAVFPHVGFIKLPHHSLIDSATYADINNYGIMVMPSSEIKHLKSLQKFAMEGHKIPNVLIINKS
jgi:hypothetical protein